MLDRIPPSEVTEDKAIGIYNTVFKAVKEASKDTVGVNATWSVNSFRAANAIELLT